MNRAYTRSLLVLLLTALCAVDSTALPKKIKKEPAPVDPKFTAIQSVSVLPIVDARAGAKAGVNMEKLQGSIVNIMNKTKRYPASAAMTSGEAGLIAEEDLQSARPEFIKKLGLAGARWVLVVCLEDVVSKITFGSTGNAEVSGYLFDKETGKLVWGGKGVGQAGQGGLMGMGMKGMMKGQAMDAAIRDLLASIPTRPKLRK